MDIEQQIQAENAGEMQYQEQQQQQSGGLAGVVVAKITRYLDNYAEKEGKGWVFGADTDFEAVGFRKKKGKETGKRQPNVAFVSLERLPALPSGAVLLAPDLAVEVFSVTDNPYVMSSKVKEYLAAGVKMVWVVNPPDQMIEVHLPDQLPKYLTVADEVNSGEVLPGFKLKIADLFGRVVAATEDED